MYVPEVFYTQKNYKFTIMKITNKILFLATLTLVLASCGPTIYLAPNFEKVKSNHNLLAILPFDVLITMKNLPKDVTPEMLKDQEKNTGYSIQSHSYTYLLQEMSKNKYTVTFQDVDKTNAMLSKAGISYDKLKEYSKEDLCKTLGVDAVISGKVTMDKPMSDVGAVALAVFVEPFWWTTTNKVNVTMTIHDKNNSNLLWKYDWENSGSIGSSSEQLTKSLMKNVSKNFPYTR
jgi:hypothetical protein